MNKTDQEFIKSFALIIGGLMALTLVLAVAATQAVDYVGLPEAQLILSQAVTYCATAPKSNASCVAISAALEDVAKDRVQPVPLHLRDRHSAGGKAAGNGKGYLYPHDHGGFAVQDYLTVPKSYYQPQGIGYESKICERLAYWKSCREQS